MLNMQGKIPVTVQKTRMNTHWYGCQESLNAEERGREMEIKRMAIDSEEKEWRSMITIPSHIQHSEQYKNKSYNVW